MGITPITSLLFMLGTALIYTGFGAFPPKIYTEKDVQEKLNLLVAHPRRWVLCQSLVILGGIATVAGSTLLPTLFKESQLTLLLKIGVGGFVLGHGFWIWHVGWQALQIQKFAKNELPGWLFVVYSVLILLARANFGVAFWLQSIHQVLGVGIFLGALLVLVLFLKYKDSLPLYIMR